MPGLIRPALIPDPDARFNVLAIHSELEGMLPAAAAMTDRAAMALSREELGVSRWDYVALGHYHVYREIAPNCYYSGSIDYTSANTWGELYEQRVSGIPARGSSSATSRPGGTSSIHCRRRARSSICRQSARRIVIAGAERRVRALVEGVDRAASTTNRRAMIGDVPRHTARDSTTRRPRLQARALNFQLESVIAGPRRRDLESAL